jgi:hypothetical protein
VQQLATEKFRVQGAVDVHEDWKHVNVFLTETVQHDRRPVRRFLGRIFKGRTHEGQVGLGPEGEEQRQQEAAPVSTEDWTSNIMVLASGNLGVIYSAWRDERANLEGIEAVYPGLLEGLARHEGIGFVMVHSKIHGPVVIGAQGRYYLADERIEGENPLAPFGPNAAAHLRRTDRFPDAPDVLVNSFYDAKTNEVAAFEELIGSHGGLGGWQTQPFLLYPAEWETGQEHIVGAEALHRVLKGWVERLASEGTTP